MKTVTLLEPGRLARSETSEPSPPGPGEALVRIHRVGICGTDLHAYRGRQPFFSYPRILGHELGVEVLALGPDVEGLAVGEHCAVEPYLECGDCPPCRRGRSNCCQKLQVLGVHCDGGMREQILVPARKLHPGRGLELEALALVETLGIGAHAVARAAVEAGEPVLVVGAGPIGLSVLEFVRLAGGRIALLEPQTERRRFASETYDAECAVAPGPELESALRDTFEGELPQVVFDATGHPESMASAFSRAESGGRIILVGLFQGELSFNDPEFHRKELSVHATRNALPGDFRRILDLLEAGRIDTGPWITHRASYDEMIERFPEWLEPENHVIKAMLEL